MGVQSQNGHLLVVTQENLNAYSDPGDSGRPGWLVPLRSGSLSESRDLLIPDPEIGGNRDVPSANLGPVAFTGDFDMYARPRLMYPFVKSASMGWGQHGLDLGAIGSDLQAFGTGEIQTPACMSIEQQIGEPGQYITQKYYNVVCNTWTLTAEASGLVQFSAGLIGQYMYGTGSPTTPTSLLLDDSQVIPASGNPDPTIGRYALVTFAPFADTGTPGPLPATSATFTVNNNIEDDDFRLGSLYLAGLSPKRREVGGTIGIRPEDASLWKQAMWGSSSATAPLGGSPTYGRLVFTVVGEPIPSTGLCQTFSISAMVALHPFTIEPSGDDVVAQDVEFTAVYPDGLLDPAMSISFILSTVSAGDPEFR